MADLKYNPIVILTPEVILDWPYLVKPDAGNEKFPKDVPEFQTKFNMLATEEAGEFVKKLEAYAEAAYKKAQEEAAVEARAAGKPAKRIKRADLPVYETEAGYSGKAKQKAWIISRKTGKRIDKTPVIVDSRVKPWPKDVDIYSGATAILQLEVVEYNSPALGAGISLRLQGAQILKLSERQAGAPQQAMGFRSQEEEDPDAQETPVTFAPQQGGNGDFM